MASTYSTNLKIELMATGENAGTWGNITNTNLGTAIEQALVGYGAVSFAADANLTITLTNSNAAQAARALVLNVTSALSLSTTRELIVPTFQKQYIVQNNTTGGQSITVKTSAGTGITVPNGRKAHLYVDGTNVIHMFDFVDINGGTIDGVTIGGGTAGAGSFTTLSASGNVTLGDASTDTVTVNGYMGVGGAPSASTAVVAKSTALTSTTQTGVFSNITGTSGATSNILGFYSGLATAAASFTAANVTGFRVDDVSKGAGSTITNQHGVFVSDLTQGTNNFGLSSQVSSGTGKWNIYASGTARNHMAGALSVGATTDPGTGGLYVAGNATLGDATTDTVTVNGYMGIGGAPNSTFALNVLNTLTSGVNQRGIRVNITGNDTSTIAGISTSVSTAASAFTVGNVSGVFLNDATKGAGSTITSQYGVYISDQTQGTSNFGIASLVSSGSNKWNIYASGTASNYFAGLTQYGVLGTPSSPIHVLQSNASSSNANGVTIEQSSTGDAQMHFLLTGTARWTMGIDNSDSDSFKIGTNQDLGTSNVLTLTTGGAASFTGNVTLGDASTDTVRVNGYMGVGNAANSVVSFYIQGTHAGSATALYANRITQTIPATTTGSWFGFANLNSATAASAFTLANAYHYYANDLAAGAGSTITSQHGLFIADLTSATSNYGIVSQVSSGTGKWNIYAGGTANNYFAGNVGIGVTTPAHPLDIISDANSFRLARIRNADTGSSAYAGFIVNASGNSWAMRMGSTAANNNALEFPVDAAGTPIVRMSLTTAGNLSLGATIPTWNTGGNIVLQGTRYLSSVGSVIGVVANGYFDTTDSRWEYASTAAATWYSQNAGQHIWYNAASGTANTALTWTQAMTLNASGNLGIGTSSPGARLDARTAATFVANLESSSADGGYLTLGRTGAQAAIGSYKSASGGGTTISTDALFLRNPNGIGFGSGGATVTAFLDTSGNLGIGTTSPVYRLHLAKSGGSEAILSDVDGGGPTQGRALTLKSPTASRPGYVGTETNHVLALYVNDTERMRIDSAGNVGIGTNSPTNTLSVSGSANITGNVTLGDASTDTVTVNGYMGIGGAPASANALRITSSELVGTSQIGMIVDATAASDATTSYQCLFLRPRTAAASFTVGTVLGINIADAVKGAGSTITNQFGINIADQTQGATSNIGIWVAVSSGTGKWNIYANGTASNYFAGKVGIGTTTITERLHVEGRLSAGAFSDRIVLGSSPLSLPTSDNNAYISWGASSVYGGTNGDLVLVPRTNVAASVRFYTGSGTPAERLRIDASGNVKIGGTADRATTAGTNQLVIFNGTAPVGTLTNGVSFYSASGEARVMDAAGNSTLLSPHDQTTNEWIFHSKHTPTGKVLRIDVERLLRFVNDHFGLDAVQEFIEN